MAQRINPALQARFDEMLMAICKDANNGIHGLLDTVFSFLLRRTDFYYEAEPGDKMGFPPKFAEGLVSVAHRDNQIRFIGLPILQEVSGRTREEVPTQG